MNLAIPSCLSREGFYFVGSRKNTTCIYVFSMAPRISKLIGDSPSSKFRGTRTKPIAQPEVIVTPPVVVEAPQTGLYKDSYFNWRESPVPKQSGQSPYLGTRANAYYPDNVLASIDRVWLDRNAPMPAKVFWDRQGEVPVPKVWQAGNQVNLQDADPVAYRNFMGDANVPSYYELGKHRRYLTDEDPRQLEGKPFKFASGGYAVYQGKDVPETPLNLKAKVFQSPDAALIGVDQTMMQGSGRENPLDVYRGNINEPSLTAIEATARRGGSGTWVNPTYGDWNENNDIFNRVERSQTQSQGMEAIDKGIRGEYVPGSNELINEAYRYNTQGNLEFAPGNLSRPAPAVGDFYEPISQNKIARLVGETPRNVLRFPEAGAAPQYQYQNVNEFGVALNPVMRTDVYGPALAYRRPPVYLSDKVVEPMTFDTFETVLDSYGNPVKILADAIPNPLAGQSRLPRGRWSGGGIQGKWQDRTSDASIDPLDSNNQISLPQGTAFVPMQTNPGLIPTPQLSLREDYVEPVTPFERQYSIKQTGNIIPGSESTRQIPGAYLPVTRVDKDGLATQELQPYLQGETREAQEILNRNPELASKYYEGRILNEHLADVVVDVDGRRYPLTPEATTTDYLPSAAQREELNRKRYGKRYEVEDDIDWFGTDEPSDAELMAIERGGVLGFDASKDFDRYVSSAAAKEVYADPNLEPTDVVSAIEEKQRQLNRMNAAIANREGSVYNGVYFPPSPSAKDVFDRESYGPAFMPDNTLKGSIVATRYSGGNDPVANRIYRRGGNDSIDPQTFQGDRFDSAVFNRESYGPAFMPANLASRMEAGLDISGFKSDYRNKRSLQTGQKEPNLKAYSRFINEDEAQRIIAQNAIPKRTRTMVGEDGVPYQEEIDYVNVGDLDFLTQPENAGRILSTAEVAANRDRLAANLGNARTAYKDLMSLEEAPEIQIVAPLNLTLGKQMKELGLQVQRSGENYIAAGGLPVGMPGENIPDLPTRYKSREVVDPEIERIYQTGLQQRFDPYYQRPEFFVPPYRKAGDQETLQEEIMSLKPQPKTNIALRPDDITNLSPSTAYFSPYGLIDAQTSTLGRTIGGSQKEVPQLMYDPRVPSNRLNSQELAADAQFNRDLERGLFNFMPTVSRNIGNMLRQAGLGDRTQQLSDRWSRNQRLSSVSDLAGNYSAPVVVAREAYPPIRPDMPDVVTVAATPVNPRPQTLSQLAEDIMPMPQYNADDVGFYDLSNDNFTYVPDVDVPMQQTAPPIADPWGVAGTSMNVPRQPMQQTAPQRIRQLPPGRRPDPFKGEADFVETPIPNYATGEVLQAPPERRNYTPAVVGGSLLGAALLGNAYQQEQERRRMEQEQMMRMNGYY